jgi:hypothetical protein
MNAANACRLVVLLTVITVSLRAATIRIHVVDGRNGKTITKERVQVWIDSSTGSALSLIPGPDGIAVLEAPEGSSIYIASNLYVDCRPFEKAAPSQAYSIDAIERDGVATRNACGKMNVEARRGELVFYVRPIRLWEGTRR